MNPTSRRSRTGAARMRRLLILGLVVAGGWLAASSRSIGKDRLAARLLALGKNEPIRRHGLEQVRLPDGVQLSYLYVGRADTAAPVVPDPEGADRARTPGESSSDATGPRPTLVLVHGTPASLFDWTSVIFGSQQEPGLIERFEVFAPDLPGHGLTPPAGAAISFQSSADHLSAFLEALDLTQVVLVGHSYGGEFAWRAALDHPARVQGLVLIDSAGYARAEGEWLPEEVAMREMELAHWGWLIHSRKRLAPALELHYERGLPADRLEEMYLLCSNADNWRAMVDLCRDENGTRAEQLTELSCPTLLLWGAEDVAYPLETFAQRFARDITGSQLVVLEGLGHYPHGERPGRVSEEISRFALETAPAR